VEKITPEEVGLSSERLGRINDFMIRYVDGGQAAGFVTLVARKGEIVFFDNYGYQDIDAKMPLANDTIFRIYSMTKPITSVGFMMLFERGLVRLEDPVSIYIPEFKNIKVLGKDGKRLNLDKEITIHNLLDHTAGLSYGGIEETKLPVDAYYDQANLFEPRIDLEEMVRRITTLPLAFQPGDKWHYSVATDVVGRLIELITDMPLIDYLREKVLDPLGMVDTDFCVPPGKRNRFSTLYGKVGEADLGVLDDAIGGDYFNVSLQSGGSGLVSTMPDYCRFAQMLLNRGEWGGMRFLGSKTVDYMIANHLSKSLLPINMGGPWHGFGFGLGFSVMLDVPLSGMMGSTGVHGWGGWANTHFWIDQIEELIGILMMQYIPSGTFPFTNDFRTAVYQAIID
jgi:CubicO group peptidase (beta-lactamase class C family)